MPKGVYKHKKPSFKTRQKMSLARMGEKNPMFGKKFSSEYRRKLAESHRGHIPWNKGKKVLAITGKNHHYWKGHGVSYRGLHYWIVRCKGKPQVCKCCKATAKEKRLHWANIDHKYRRILKDYVALCAKCHGEYDKKQKELKRLSRK